MKKNTLKTLRKGSFNTAVKIERGNICLYYSRNGKPLYIPTGFKEADKKSQERNWVDKFNKFEKLIIDFEKEQTIPPSVTQVKELYNLISNTTDDFVGLFDMYIRTKKDQVKESTYANLKSKDFYFKQFQEKFKPNINRLDETFVLKFQKFLFEYKFINNGSEKIGLSDGYSTHVLRMLKKVLELGYKLNKIKKYQIDWTLIFKKMKVVKKTHEALTLDELKFLYSKRNSFETEIQKLDTCPFCGSENFYRNNPKPLRYLCRDCGKTFYEEINRGKALKESRLKKSLNLFLFQCYTSLRYSDAIKVKKENIRDGILYIQATKNSNNQEIPLNANSLDILESNNFDLNVVACTYRNHIKELLERYSTEMESFGKIVPDVRIVNKLEQVFMVPRYERIASHTGRRTFITIMLNNGEYNDGEIMKISGHADHNVFKGYYDIRPPDEKKKMTDFMC